MIRVDRDAVWNVLRLYGIGGRLLQGVKSLYVSSKACVRVGNEMSEWFPVDWVITGMMPLYKGKGDVHECSNFRSISLLSVVGKVYGRILINRITDKTENVIAEVQSGFRRGRGCTDQIFIVREICEKYLGKGKDVYFAFLDLEKAYDRVDRDAMWNVLRLYGIGGRLLQGVKSLYVSSKTCVRVENEMSEWFPVRVGLRQGCVMSP